MVWTKCNETVQVSLKERKVVRRFLPRLQYQLAIPVVALVCTDPAREGLG